MKDTPQNGGGSAQSTAEAIVGIGREFAAMKAQQDRILTQLDELTKGAGKDSPQIVEIQKQLDELRRLQISLKASKPRRKGHMSEEAARQLGAQIFLRGQLIGSDGAFLIRNPGDRERLEHEAREALGISQKSTLTSSDIPQLVEYQSEVVEMISEYGLARNLGTEIPLGADSVKVPYLSTDTAFGAIDSAGSIPEKSPAVTQVTLTPNKLGGIVRFPREIQAGSIIAFGQFVGRYAARNFAKAEDSWFFTGDGTSTYGSQTGVLKVVDVSATRTVMASTKTKYSDATLANFRAIRGQVATAALRRGAYFLHPSFEQLLTTYNTGGDYPYRTGSARAAMIGGGANGVIADATLDGFPIVWVDSLPAFSTSNNADKVFAAFGDVSFMYLGIRQAPEVTISDQVYWATDEIGIRCLERISVNSLTAQTAGNNALSGLKTAAS